MSIHRIVTVTIASVFAAARLLAQGSQNLDDKAKAARAKQIAEAFENNARTLTLFDRDGKGAATVGPRDITGLAILFSTNPKQYACGFGSARPLQRIEPDSTQPVVSSAKADGEPL